MLSFSLILHGLSYNIIMLFTCHFKKLVLLMSLKKSYKYFDSNMKTNKNMREIDNDH